MDVRLNQLAQIVAVARAGTFTAASNSVGLTQSAITKTVADLERQLGYALFHRTARGAVLTDKGRAFVERASRLLDDARELLHGDPSGAEAFSGVLRIGVCPASLEWLLINPVSALQTRHPRLRFDVSASSFDRMVHLLRNGGVDVVLGFDAAFGDWPDLHREPMADLHSMLFVRKGHPILRKQRPAWSDVTLYDLISPSESRPYGALLRSAYEEHGRDWRSKMHAIDFFPLVQRIVANSDAIGVVAKSYAASRSFQAGFTAIEGEGEAPLLPPAAMCCATRARWEPSAASRAFIEAVSSS